MSDGVKANVLIVAEAQGGRIRPATLRALSAGRALAHRTGGRLHALVMGREVSVAAEALRAFADVVLVAEADLLVHPLAEVGAPVVVEAVRASGAGYVGAAATAFAKDLLPRTAAQMGAATASDVIAFGGSGADVTFTRPMWAGNVLAEVELATPIKAFTLRATDFPLAEASPVAGQLQPLTLATVPVPRGVRWVELREVRRVRAELTEARVVISGGRGTQGNFKDLEGLADEVGGAVGATRAAVDAGWAPNDWQIGQTGKVVAPDLYVAAGISGAIQHVAGMKGSKVIVAINKDPDAPIFQIADYGLVADLSQALPALRAKVKAAR